MESDKWRVRALVAEGVVKGILAKLDTVEEYTTLKGLQELIKEIQQGEYLQSPIITSVVDANTAGDTIVNIWQSRIKPNLVPHNGPSLIKEVDVQELRNIITAFFAEKFKSLTLPVDVPDYSK